MKAPIFENVKKKYRALEEPHKKIINDLDNERKDIWENSIEYLILSKFDILPTIGIKDYFTFVTIALFLVAFDLNLIGLILFGVITIYVLLLIVVHFLKTPLKNQVLRRNEPQLLPYIQKADRSKNSLEKINQDYTAAWEGACETYESYPPDWNDRREQVLFRDGYKCTKCGYPDGFKRKSRDLHVHHIVPLYKGGSNSLKNLTTLCHICHRNIDKKHSRIRKISKKKRYKKYS
ncbi:MAG: HNH endonuclease [Desulfobacterales bacterium]|nr:HNH endonuclease [Desulfobacterales bacterium]